MCNACLGCALANPTKSKSSELVYNFPIKAPFLVLFVDTYSTGKHSCFNGYKMYLVACCGMTGFASMEPIIHANSKSFATAIMQIQLHYGLCHTIVLDKDSKFYSICCHALDQLHKPITAHPFKEAGLKEFMLITLFKVTTHFLTANQAFAFHWASLLESNNDIIPFPWLLKDKQHQYLSGDTILTLPTRRTYLFLSCKSCIQHTQSFHYSELGQTFSSFQTVPIKMRLASGILSAWHFKNPCLPTSHACKMGVSSLTSMFTILAIHG
jgi:hypothetical protein